MNNLVHKEQIGKFTLNVYYELDPVDPREFENVCRMACFNNKYSLGDRCDYKMKDFYGWEDFKAQIIKDHDPLIIKPLYLLDHSGLSISTKPFDCPWDSGQVGWVYIPRANISKKDGMDYDKIVEIEVKTYNFFINGEVYFYIIEDENGNQDSCGGFYGFEDVVNEARRVIKELGGR